MITAAEQQSAASRLPGGALALQDITFAYDGEEPLFARFSFSVEPGEFIAIIGGNGSGKSTLALLAAGLLQPQSGTVSTINPDGSPAQVGLVFQNPDDQLVASIVEDEAAFGPANLGVEREELRKRTTEALRTVGLSDLATAPVATLSGGQRQRLAVAGALALQPSILILDEATSMLDPQGAQDLLSLCKQLNRQGMTVIMITQDMEEAFQAPRIVVLDHGAIIADGVPEKIVLEHSRLQKAGLELPFASRFSSRLQAAGLPIASCTTETSLEEELCALHFKK